MNFVCMKVDILLQLLLHVDIAALKNHGSKYSRLTLHHLINQLNLSHKNESNKNANQCIILPKRHESNLLKS